MSENYTLINWQNGEITQPAIVEIDGVDYQVQPAIETGNTPINADNLNHMDNGIRNATLKLNDKIETATVKLIAVSATAPSECSEGDKYYNTSTNLIYTATGTDTWGVTGEQPSTLYTYMNTYNTKIYYYDGTSFSEYGGGSSSLVVHDSYNTSTTEPYSANYVNNAIPEIHDSYNSSTTEPYSCNYINGIVESGSNANGNYVKYIDGTMICSNQISTTSSLSAYYSTLTRTNEIAVTFPQTFTTDPNVTITPYAHQTIGCSISSTGITTTGFGLMLYKANGATDTTCVFNYIAIGKWK